MRGMAGTVTPSVDAEGGRVEQPRSQLDGHFPPVPSLFPDLASSPPWMPFRLGPSSWSRTPVSPRPQPGPSDVTDSYELRPQQLYRGPILTDSSFSSQDAWRPPSPAHGSVPCPFSSGGRVAFSMACHPDISDFSKSSSTVCQSDLSSLQI